MRSIGLDVQLEDENANCLPELPDCGGALVRSLDALVTPRHPLLSGIDPSADTIFNGRHVAQLLHEWNEISSTANAGQRLLLDEARALALATQCLAEPHLHLRFAGD